MSNDKVMFSELLFDHKYKLELIHYHDDEPTSRGSCAVSCSGEFVTSEVVVVVSVVIVIVVMACNYKNNNNKKPSIYLYSYPILFCKYLCTMHIIGNKLNRETHTLTKKILILITYFPPTTTTIIIAPSISIYPLNAPAPLVALAYASALANLKSNGTQNDDNPDPASATALLRASVKPVDNGGRGKVGWLLLISY